MTLNLVLNYPIAMARDNRVCVRAIPRRRAEKLFEAFHTTKTGGIGIGLSVSRSTVEAGDGLRADGPGVTFSFALPTGAISGGPDLLTSSPSAVRPER